MVEGRCRARLANIEVTLEFGDLNEAAGVLSPLWRCSVYSDCRLRRYCGERVVELAERLQTLRPVTCGRA